MTKKKSPIKAAVNRRRRQSDDVADWGGCEPSLLHKLIETVTSDGGAIRFGYSRDGGAYSLGIYGDGKPYTEYRPSSVELESWLEEIIEDFS